MGYEIYLHPYDLGESIRQAAECARRGPQKPVMRGPLSQAELEMINNDPDLLKGIENYIPDIIKKIK